MTIALGCLFCAILFLIFISPLSMGGEVYRASRKVNHMSASFDTLTADVKSVVALVATLNSTIAALNSTVADQTAQIEKLKAEAGTPDVQVDALDAELKAVLPPAAPPAEVAPSA